jgi:glycosyltransferase involved in cell wall biosynthesis
MSRVFPGIAILHDFVMHHFFAAYCFEHLESPDAYVSTMERTYGIRGREAATEMLAGTPARIWETESVTDFPLFEEIIREGYGVIAHSEFFCDRVRAVFPGPVRRIPLAYDTIQTGFPMSRKELNIPQDAALLVTVGHVNPNKRIHQVIQVLAEVRKQEPKLIYAVVGPWQDGYYEQLTREVQRLGLQHCVRFVGAASDAVLNGYLAQADICINLRHPAIEGASASAVEEMLLGKALVVSATGFFAELPDDTVCKIGPNREATELGPVLLGLLHDRGARELLGAHAKEFATRTFVASGYVDQLLPFLNEVGAAKPLLQLADRCAAELKVMGVSPEMDIVDTIAQESYQLFCKTTQERMMAAGTPTAVTPAGRS